MRRMNFPACLTLAVLAAAMTLVQLAASASAQTPFAPAQVVNVSVNFSTQVPLPDLSEEAVSESQKNGRVSLYKLARDECDVMKSVIAEACRLTNMNISTQIQNHHNQNPIMLYVNGSANFTISLKEDAGE